MTRKRIFMFLLLGLCLGSVMGQHVAIGDILCSDGSTVRREAWTGSKTPVGVVFYVHKVDGVWHGWALSLQESGNVRWAENGSDNCNFNTPVTNKSAAVSDMAGAVNTQTALGLIGGSLTDSNYPAYHYIKTLRDVDANWYLPALGQLHYLYAQIPEVNATLETLDGAKPIEGETNGTFSYWPSTEYNTGSIWFLNYDGCCGNYAAKSMERRVRAVRDF